MNIIDIVYLLMALAAGCFGFLFYKASHKENKRKVFKR